MRKTPFSSWVMAVLAGLVTALLACGGAEESGTGPEGPGGNRPPSGDLQTVTLFFPGTGELLVKEERRLPKGTPEEQIRAIVQALLEGPEAPEARPVLPGDTTVGGVYLGTAEVVYLDLHRTGNKPPPPMGSLQETLMIYSLVNSVVLNVQGVERLSLLWNGTQQESLAGHLSNGGPLEPRPQLAR